MGVLCRVVQELCQCLAPLIEEGCLLRLEMLDVAEKDPVAPTPAPAPSSLTPNPEEEQVTLTPNESCTSEPEGAAFLEGELTLVWGQYPTRLPGFACLLVTQTHASLGRGMPLGAQLDLYSPGVTTGNHTLWPGGQGSTLQMPVLDGDADFTATSL